MVNRVYICDVILCSIGCIVQLAGLISRQEGDIQGSLELFQQAVRLNSNNAANIKQVARSL